MASIVEEASATPPPFRFPYTSPYRTWLSWQKATKHPPLPFPIHIPPPYQRAALRWPQSRGRRAAVAMVAVVVAISEKWMAGEEPEGASGATWP